MTFGFFALQQRRPSLSRSGRSEALGLYQYQLTAPVGGWAVTPRVACRGLKGARTVLTPFFSSFARKARGPRSGYCWVLCRDG